MIIRPVGTADVTAVAAIYAHHVLRGTGTFEEVPPSEAALAERIGRIAAFGLPYLVIQPGVGERLTGFAYAAPFRPRAAYRFTVEDSVYVAPEAGGHGVGKALLGAVIAACEAQGLRQMIAVIGDAGNAASIGLHRALGFVPAGVCRSVGFKHGRWLDTVWMQRSLNEGDRAAPTQPGLALSGG